MLEVSAFCCFCTDIHLYRDTQTHTHTHTHKLARTYTHAGSEVGRVRAVIHGTRSEPHVPQNLLKRSRGKSIPPPTPSPQYKVQHQSRDLMCENGVDKTQVGKGSAQVWGISSSFSERDAKEVKPLSIFMETQFSGRVLLELEDKGSLRHARKREPGSTQTALHSGILQRGSWRPLQSRRPMTAGGAEMKRGAGEGGFVASQDDHLAVGPNNARGLTRDMPLRKLRQRK